MHVSDAYRHSSFAQASGKLHGVYINFEKRGPPAERPKSEKKKRKESPGMGEKKEGEESGSKLDVVVRPDPRVEVSRAGREQAG